MNGTEQTKRALLRHDSGNDYLVEVAAVWSSDGDCIGSQIVAAVGPIDRAELDEEPGALLFDRIDSVKWELTDEDAGWLQDEDEAGRVWYPIGVR